MGAVSSEREAGESAQDAIGGAAVLAHGEPAARSLSDFGEKESSPMSLAGKQIVIIGGASGIGLAVAVRAAAENAEVTVVSSSQDRVDAAVRQCAW
jgi:NADPH:quinone reductase-like Zn-dependent oxidoreductase